MNKYPSSREIFTHLGHKPTMSERLLAGIYDLLREQNGKGSEDSTPLSDCLPPEEPIVVAPEPVAAPVVKNKEAVVNRAAKAAPKKKR